MFCSYRLYGALPFTEIRQLFHSLYTCLNNMFYNRDNRNGNSGRAVYPSTAQPLIQKDGECIHGACKRCSDARFVIARTIRNRRLWLECLRLRRFSRLVQTTLLADSAPYDDQLWRFALSVVLGPRRQPQLYRLCRAYRGRVSGAARYRWRVSGIRPQQCRLRCYLWRPPSGSRPSATSRASVDSG